MAQGLLHEVDHLRDELQEFYHVLRRGEGDVAGAVARLRAAISRAEPMIVVPPDQVVTMALEQRWGYLQLVSLLQSARVEVERCSRN
ncbi:MAG: hypothetical protein HOP18_23800 [Deltaproteobacteria bacterium]|nr:hypothetical protein [Deltaproteobacteria bacterium]